MLPPWNLLAAEDHTARAKLNGAAGSSQQAVIHENQAQVDVK